MQAIHERSMTSISGPYPEFQDFDDAPQYTIHDLKELKKVWGKTKNDENFQKLMKLIKKNEAWSKDPLKFVRVCAWLRTSHLPVLFHHD